MFFKILALVGSVVGSGFITGKEIALFFARNGYWGYLGGGIAIIIFFLMFRLFLLRGEKINKILSSNKFFISISLILNTILSSSMLSGMMKVSGGLPSFARIVIIILVFAMCFLIFKRGGGAFNKLNLIFVPIMILSFLVIILSMLGGEIGGGEVFSSIWFSLLYTALNISSMALLLSSMGEGLSNRQKTQVALISSLAFGVLLLITVTVLIQNEWVIGYDMPLLYLASGWKKGVMSLLVFVGSLTTLFSLVFSSSSYLRGLNINEMINFSISILLPSLISLCGFGFIVTYLYPLASVFGILLLFALFLSPSFFHPLFKNSNKKIHSASKDTEKDNACHHDIKF